MCTVTWVHQEDGYHLLCNRDEKLTRQQAIPPRLHTRDGVHFIAPVDPEFGGAWIATNEFGVSLCLLNGQEVRDTETNRGARKSRGLLVLDLITAKSAASACDRISSFDLSIYLAFTLAVLEPGRQTTLVEWNGLEKTIIPCAERYLPLTSSSFDARGVQERRRADYLHLSNSGETRQAFHESHGPAPDAYSTCMHRPDAATVSFSQIHVTDEAATFFYTPAAPCNRVPGQITTLAFLQ